MKFLSLIIGFIATGVVPAAWAQGWSPQKNVEIVVGSAPGGSNDKTARSVERALVTGKLVPTSVTVANKPGGGSSIAFTYVTQHPGGRPRACWPPIF